MLKSILNLIIVACSCLFLLIACKSPYQSPVAEIDEPRFLDSDRIHRVNEGETLYAIAWIYDLDFIQIARANALSSPYTIFPGQIINVDPRAEPLQLSPNSSRTVSSTSTRTPATPSVRNTNSPAVNNRSRDAQRSTGNSGAGQATRAVEVSPAVVRQGPVSWGWPTQGNIISRFSETSVDSKGIDIAGSRGEAVMSAADGEVVYAGNGLLRYGELLIIKHNDRFLSAYAHNDRLSVAEGDKVRRGQKIAELGSTGVDKEMLHFEIRLEGKPVDPMMYLPPRS